MKTETDLNNLAKQLWALGDPVRLHILRILPSEPTCANACNVSTIAERIGLSQPAISHHLRVLRQAGLITSKKMCRDMIYCVRPEAVLSVAEAMQAVFRDTAEKA